MDLDADTAFGSGGKVLEGGARLRRKRASEPMAKAATGAEAAKGAGGVAPNNWGGGGRANVPDDTERIGGGGPLIFPKRSMSRRCRL
mmetsp:Transcript_54502/g.158339  ORF Transcript_54502/g.158339 Transcript_54502/m.158339 type:complete len:87 (+) Transcript_54502:859-1119(+)